MSFVYQTREQECKRQTLNDGGAAPGRTSQAEPLTFGLQALFELSVSSDFHPSFLTHRLILDLGPDVPRPPGIQGSISSVSILQ